MSKVRGDKGEIYALSFLESKGHQLVQKNFHSKFGEIDLITRYENELYFTEVKAFSSARVIHPIHHITKSKINKINKTIKYYMSRHNIWNTQIHTSILLIIAGEIDTYIEDAYDLF